MAFFKLMDNLPRLISCRIKISLDANNRFKLQNDIRRSFFNIENTRMKL